MVEIGATQVASTQQRFLDQRGPDGEAWRPLHPATLLRRAGRRVRTRRGRFTARARRRMAGAQILRDSNRLYSSLTYDAGRFQAAWGTNVVYGAAHQFGYEHIPARPYLGMTDDDRATAGDILVRHLGEAVR